MSAPDFPATPIAFATDLGTVDTPRTTVNGAAMSTLRAGATAGTANPSAKLDNATATTKVTFVAPPPPPPPPAAGPGPRPGPSPGPKPRPKKGPWISISGRALKVLHGRAGIRLSCAQTKVRCVGRLTLTARKGRRIVVVGTARFSIRARHTATIRVRLSAPARRTIAVRPPGLIVGANARGVDKNGYRRFTGRFVRLHR